MTKKLYYTDAYQTAFTANVVKSEEDYIVLSETCFYPTGGGQPNDTGVINGLKVLGVEEVEGEIRHYLEGSITVGTIVEGSVDWMRRYDHMQQHTGQHILSAAFAELYNYETIGFHLGIERVTIDLDVESIQPHELEKVEKLANQIILDQRPIDIKWVTKEEIIQYPLRKQPSVNENIRLVIIPNYDYNGCGGTHLKSTGEVQAIKIIGMERQKKKVRIEFVCGHRVLQQLHEKTAVLVKLTGLLNAPQVELEGASIRLLEKNKSLEKEIKNLQDQLLRYEATELVQQSSIIGAVKIVQKVYKDRELQELQNIAKNILQIDQNVAIFLVSESNGKLQFVCQRGNYNLNMKNIALAVLPVINGKGGGNEKQAQGGGEAKTISGQSLLTMLLNQMKNN